MNLRKMSTKGGLKIWAQSGCKPIFHLQSKESPLKMTKKNQNDQIQSKWPKRIKMKKNQNYQDKNNQNGERRIAVASTVPFLKNLFLVSFLFNFSLFWFFVFDFL